MITHALKYRPWNLIRAALQETEFVFDGRNLVATGPFCTAGEPTPFSIRQNARGRNRLEIAESEVILGLCEKTQIARNSEQIQDYGRFVQFFP